MVSLPEPYRYLLRNAYRDADEEAFERAILAEAAVTVEELESCLEERRRLGEAVRLSEILLRRGFLSPQHYLEILDRLHAPPTPLANRLGRYVLVREVARGGMGIVHEATDTDLRRRVALKVLRDGEADPETLRRLHREAAIAAQLRHPNIVAVHEVGVAPDGQGRPTHFIVMDFVEGETLADLVARGRTPRRELLRMLEEVSLGVAYAHARGVVHRDLKPGNVLVEQGGRVMLTDFGLAKAKSFATRLTRTHGLMGTPQYMSPEQVEGRTAETDSRSDVFSLGVMLYEILTGHPPFSGTTPPELFLRILKSDPVRPSLCGRDVSRDLEVICLKALCKERIRRYADAGGFAEDLARARRGEPILARPPSWSYRIKKRLARRPGIMAILGTVLLAAIIAGVGLREISRRRDLRLEQLRREMETKERDRRRFLDLQAQRIRPLERKIEETRQGFYIPDIDIRARLGPLERALEELEPVAADPAFARHPDVWTTLGTGWYVVGNLTRAEQALLRAAELVPTDARIHAYLGRVYLELAFSTLVGSPREAQERIKSSRRLNAQAQQSLRLAAGGWEGSTELERHLARAHLAMVDGTREGVQALCQEGMERFPSLLGVEEFQCLLAAADQNSPAAFELLNQALRRRPHYPWGRFLRGAMRAQQGESGRALADYSAALEVFPQYRPALLNRGTLLHGLQEWKRAEADFTEVLRMDGADCDVLYNRGIVRGDLGKFEEAIVDFTEVLRLRPEFVEAYVNRGIVRRRKGDLLGSLEDQTRALGVQPGHPTALLNRAGVRKEIRDFEAALTDYAEFLKVEPGHAGAHFARGEILGKTGNFRAAVAEYTSSLRSEPWKSATWNRRAHLRLASNDVAGGLADASQALLLDPHHPGARYARGFVLQAAGNHSSAIQEFTRALDAKPTMEESFTRRGSSRAAVGDRIGACADFADALRVFPTHAPAWYMRGNARRKLGDQLGALADYTQALVLKPRDPETWRNRGNARYSLGDLSGAVRDYERALECASPDWSYRAGTQKDLQRVRKKLRRRGN